MFTLTSQIGHTQSIASVVGIFGGKTVRVAYMSWSPFGMFSLQVKQIRETCPA